MMRITAPMMPDTTYAPSRPTGREIVRLIPGTRVQVPRFFWPSQRHLTPSTCEHCGARLIANDVPSASFPFADIACWCCSRIACELVADGWRRSISAAEFRALPPVKNGTRGPDPSPDAIPSRLTRLLDHGKPIPAAEVRKALGIQDNALRQAAHVARRRGFNIVCEAGVYRMVKP